MVTIEIVGDRLKLEVVGWHKVWALKSRIDVPLAHITRVYTDPALTLGWYQGIRAPGTHFPGLIVAGTYYKDGKRIFWDVVDTERAVIIDLTDEAYQRLVVEVEDPSATIASLQDKLGAIALSDVAVC